MFLRFPKSFLSRIIRRNSFLIIFFLTKSNYQPTNAPTGLKSLPFVRDGPAATSSANYDTRCTLQPHSACTPERTYFVFKGIIQNVGRYPFMPWGFSHVITVGFTSKNTYFYGTREDLSNILVYSGECVRLIFSIFSNTRDLLLAVRCDKTVWTSRPHDILTWNPF